MKFKTTSVTRGVNILANDHYVAIPYNCSALEANAEGVVPAGTIVPANDATAFGVLLNDVVKADDPNGAIVIHGFIKKSTLPVAPAETVEIPLVKFVD